MTMRMTPAGLALIKEFEGCRLAAYQDDAGYWTIGWGHRGPEISEGATWTQEQADAQLLKDVESAEHMVNFLTSGVDLSDSEVSALTCFVFNLGVKRLKDSSLLACIKAKDFDGAAEQFPRWCHVAGVVSQGLLRRRMAEMELFLDE